MKIARILVLLIAISTIANAQQQPQAPAPQAAHSVFQRPITKESERFCKSCCTCCSVTLVTCCLYSVILMSKESRVKTQIETLQATEIGREAIAHFQKEAYQKGLIAGQTQCPKHSPQEMLRDDAYQPCLCLDLTVQRVLKKNN